MQFIGQGLMEGPVEQARGAEDILQGIATEVLSRFSVHGARLEVQPSLQYFRDDTHRRFMNVEDELLTDDR